MLWAGAAVGGAAVGWGLGWHRPRPAQYPALHARRRARPRPPARSPPTPPGTPPRSVPATASGLSAGAPADATSRRQTLAPPAPRHGMRTLRRRRPSPLQATLPVCLPRQAQLWARAAIDGLADARAPCDASRHAHTRASPPLRSQATLSVCLPPGAAMGSRSYRWAGAEAPDAGRAGAFTLAARPASASSCRPATRPAALTAELCRAMGGTRVGSIEAMLLGAPSSVASPHGAVHCCHGSEATLPPTSHGAPNRQSDMLRASM